MSYDELLAKLKQDLLLQPQPQLHEHHFPSITLAALIMWLVVVILILMTIRLSLFLIHTQEAGVIERFGKFLRVATPGLNFKIPFVDQIAGHESLRVTQYDVSVDTKTKDNVFVQVLVSVQTVIPPDRVQDAFYKLTEIGNQIRSYAENVVLSHVPSMDFDEVFNNSQTVIANFVKNELDTTLKPFGYEVVRALVTNVVPPPNVREAMDRINAARRNQIANEAQGEADKILLIKKAEAESRSKTLQGEGIASQRKAIIDGLKASVKDFTEATDVKTDDVMALVLLTQYFDTLKELGMRSNTIMIPHSPAAVRDLMTQIRDGVITGELAAKT